MSNYDDGSFDLYNCPECNEEYADFQDMMTCYKGHYENKED